MLNYEVFQEAYEITKTIEILTTRDLDGGGGPSNIRIEMLQCLQTGKYTVRWSQQISFHLQPSYPVIEGNFAKEMRDFPVWAPLDNMPWVDEPTEDRATQRALSWLKDRVL